MPTFTRLYLDTNVLHANHWPRGSPRIAGIAELARNFGVAVLIPQAVEDEREGQWIRQTTRAFGGVKKATKELRIQLATVNELVPDVVAFSRDELRQKYRVASAATRTSLGIQLSPTTARTAAELLPLAIRREAPFREVGDHVTGFQDAVILFSVLDDAHAAGAAACALWSADGHFRNTDPTAVSVGVRFVHFQSFDALFGVFADEIAPALAAWWETDRNAARAAIEASQASIEQLLLKDTAPETVGPLINEIVAVKIVGVVGVETPLPAFPNVPPPYARQVGSVSTIACSLLVTFDVLGTTLTSVLIARFLGQQQEALERPPETEPAGLQKQSISKTVELECRGSFTGEWYELGEFRVTKIA